MGSEWNNLTKDWNTILFKIFKNFIDKLTTVCMEKIFRVQIYDPYPIEFKKKKNSINKETTSY